MKRISHLLLFAVWLLPLTLLGQMEDPVHFSVSQKRISLTEVQVTFSATIDEGWHVYSSNTPAGGPTVARLHLDKQQGATPLGGLKPQGTVKEHMDPVFQMKVRYMEGKAVFVQRFKLTAKDYHVQGYLEYGACDDQSCLPPGQVDFALKGSDGPADATATGEHPSPASPDGVTSDTALAATANGSDTAADQVSSLTGDSLPAYWQPVISELHAQSNTAGSTTTNQRSLWMLFVLGLLGGLVAVITPCVWPIIPMTVSFFLKRSEHHKGKSLRDALLYGLSIVIIYVGLGLIVTLVRRPEWLNAISTGAVFNLICFVLLVVFAISFMGGFELTLPSSWGNKTDSNADRLGGLAGIFLMALTLAIVSFSCTAPVVGFLLVELATSTSYLAPMIGMLGFALALALPFTLFALFPQLIKRAPKSGSWMNTVKVTLGFIELAFSLKFLSVADMAYGWHILPREAFISLWVVLFALLGLYLLGKLRFPLDAKRDHTSLPGFFAGLVSSAFALYMVPGLWGAPLKAVSAFLPPMSTQDFNLAKAQAVEARYTDYDQAIAAARAEGKPLLIDFTGYGCVNCRKMEGAVWTDSRVGKLLTEDYILVSLYVDDKTPLPAPLQVTYNGRTRLLHTVGDKWSFLQAHKFGANIQPFYVALSPDGHPLAPAYYYDEDVNRYINFLKGALLSKYRH